MVLFVHGGAVDSRIWTGVIRLVEPVRRCVRYDRRGLGRSRAAPRRGSHTDDLVAVLEWLGAPALVAASSVGAAVALEAAVVRPGRVSGLCLVGPLLVGHPMASATAEQLGGLRRAAARSADALVDAFTGDPTLVGSPPPGPEVLESIGAIVRDNRHAWLDEPKAGPPASARARLADIASPTAVLVGADDQEANRAMAAELAGAVPGATLRVVAGAGHLIEAVRPEAVAEAILALV